MDFLAALSPVSQVFVSTAAVLFAAGFVWALRQVVKIVRAAGDALNRLDEFTAAATAQLQSNAELDAIARQLGTLTRRKDLTPLEDYLHDWKHQWDNSLTVSEGLIATQVKTLTRTAEVLGEMSQVLSRITALEEKAAH